MFTLPPRPPKDYYIDDVTKNLRSSAQYTASDRPRVTQSSLAKHCVPIEYVDDEMPEKVPVVIHPKVLEKMMLKERYSWLTRPGKEDFYIHEMFRKYSMDKDKGIYDPRYMHKEKIFNRSYQFELDCIEASRLDKLRVKNETEDAEFEGSFQRLLKKQIEKETPPIPIVPCKAQPPKWWPVTPEPDEPVVETINVAPVYTRSSARWIEEPNLTAFVQDNPCQRKKDMLLNYKSNCPKDTNIKSGKSCLFSLSPEQAEDAINKLDIYVSIYKKMPPGSWMPANVEIGSALISIANLFEELINCITTSTGEEGSSPTAKTLKDDFDISTPNGEICGKIGVYIRLSCFGKLIVTQFQMNLQDKSVLFKDKEGKSLYRYKKAGKGSKSNDRCTPKSIISNSKHYNDSCPTTPCGGDGRGSQRASFNNQQAAGSLPNAPPSSPMNPFENSTNKLCVETCPFKPCLIEQNVGAQIPGAGGYGTMGSGGGQFNNYNGGGVGCNAGQRAPMGFVNMGMSREAPCMECGKIPNAPCLPPVQFGASGGGFMGGYGNAVSPVTPSSEQPCSECYPCPFTEDSCTCAKTDPEGNYQEIGASMGGNSLTIRVHKDNKVEPVDDDMSGSCVCKNAKNNMNLNIQPGIQQAGKDLPFAFRMGQQGQGQGGGVVVNPPTCSAPNGAKVTEFSDPNKELFVLRIGKKSEGVDKKQNLELELCTPKGPELKPIPQKKSTDTQYDPADAGPEKGKKGKGKGGKDKGKKKKK